MLPMVKALAFRHPVISQVLALVDDRVTAGNTSLRLTIVATEVAVTPPHLSRCFRNVTGIRFQDYVAAVRVERALAEIHAKPYQTLTRTAYECGFTSPRTFEYRFKQLLGLTPRQYRNEVRGWLEGSLPGTDHPRSVEGG
jgi:AraC-like DNA-binding protein